MNAIRLLRPLVLGLSLVFVGLTGRTISVDAQGLDPSAFRLFTVPAGTWPTYNGDYSGRRYIDLDQINQGNVDLLKIEWIYRIRGVGPQRGVGGPTIKSTPL